MKSCNTHSESASLHHQLRKFQSFLCNSCYHCLRLTHIRQSLSLALPPLLPVNTTSVLHLSPFTSDTQPDLITGSDRVPAVPGRELGRVQPKIRILKSSRRRIFLSAVSVFIPFPSEFNKTLFKTFHRNIAYFSLQQY